ncbi:MAG TPA: hypothetical protein VG056_07760 [Pirellulales bacterium]|nr:hypothetical protein [Pirellulales bacterium]
MAAATAEQAVGSGGHVVVVAGQCVCTTGQVVGVPAGQVVAAAPGVQAVGIGGQVVAASGHSV